LPLKKSHGANQTVRATSGQSNSNSAPALDGWAVWLMCEEVQ
jgi:hypothetical protein